MAATQQLQCPYLVAHITTLAPEPFDVIKEIPVVIQPSDDEFLATFFDANVNASGCTETDAVSNLKDVLVGLFEYLDAQPPSRLGKAPTRQIAVLRQFVRKRQ